MGAVDARVDLADRLELRDARGSAGLDRRLQQLPDGHPSSPYYAEAGRGIESGGDDGERVDADRIRSLTDAEHAEHVADVKACLANATAEGRATDLRHTIDPAREFWSAERESHQDALVDDLYGIAAGVPCERKAILAGGMPGAGKTTVLVEHAGIDLSQYLMINPDIIKEEMARRGLIPAIEGLSPMEASDLVHEESSHIAKRLARRAEADGKNVIWDITMSSSASTALRIDALRAADYRSVDAIFVDIPVNVSLRRTAERHRQGHDEYRTGLGFGGRYVPPETILEHVDAEWGSRNSKTFEDLKGRFDGWTRYDNSIDGRAPVIVEARQHHDDDRRIVD